MSNYKGESKDQPEYPVVVLVEMHGSVDAPSVAGAESECPGQLPHEKLDIYVFNSSKSILNALRYCIRHFAAPCFEQSVPSFILEVIFELVQIGAQTHNTEK